ncbi:cytochrome P450 [Sarocladium strictum]
MVRRPHWTGILPSPKGRRWRHWNKERCKPAKTRAPVRDPILGFDFAYDNLFSSKPHSNLAKRRESFCRLGQTYSVERWSYHMVQTCDSRNIRHILAIRFSDFALPELRNRAIASFLGFGIFTLNGHAWSLARSVLRPGFAKQKVDGMLDLLEGHLEAFWGQLPVLSETVDLQPLFFELAMDVATEFLLGHSTSELQASALRSRNHQFVSDYLLCSEAVVKKLRLGPLQFLIGSIEASKAKARVFEYMDNFVEEAKQCKSEEKAGPGYDVLQELQKMAPDHKTLRAQVLHILLASRDTVACLLSNLVFALSKQPAVYSRLRQEVLDCTGSDRPNIEQLHSMKYLKWCVNESLRLHPVIPTNAREAAVDTTLPFGGGHDGNSPLFIKKGTLVMYNAYAMHRNPDVFGEDADKYVPERWEALRPGWDFLPFNGGPRVCIGQQFALTETYYIMATIAQRYAKIESRDDRDWQEREALAITCKHGVAVGLVQPSEIGDI